MADCANYGWLCKLWLIVQIMAGNQLLRDFYTSLVLAVAGYTNYGWLYKLWLIVQTTADCSSYGWLCKLWQITIFWQIVQVWHVQVRTNHVKKIYGIKYIYSCCKFWIKFKYFRHDPFLEKLIVSEVFKIKKLITHGSNQIFSYSTYESKGGTLNLSMYHIRIPFKVPHVYVKTRTWLKVAYSFVYTSTCMKMNVNIATWIRTSSNDTYCTFWLLSPLAVCLYVCIITRK